MKQIFSALMLAAIFSAMTAHAEVDETEKQIEKLTPIFDCKFSMQKNPMYPKLEVNKTMAKSPVEMSKAIEQIEQPEQVATAGTMERWGEIWTDIRDEETMKIEKRFEGLDKHLRKILAKGKSIRPMTEGDVYSLKEGFCTCEENQIAVDKMNEAKKKLVGKFKVEGNRFLSEKDLSCS